MEPHQDGHAQLVIAKHFWRNMAFESRDREARQREGIKERIGDGGVELGSECAGMKAGENPGINGDRLRKLCKPMGVPTHRTLVF